MRHFYVSHIVTLIGLVLAWFWGGANGLIIAGLLMVMEISLSFDNAVVNATVLKNMAPIWQKRFLTWGILIAVFGMRLVFPIVIVALATGLGMVEVTRLAFDQPEVYSSHVLASHISIASFGGMFLMMVFLHFILDETRDLHWIGVVERKLSRLGKLESVEVVVALAILLGMQPLLDESERASSMIAGVMGVMLYVFVSSITALFGSEETTPEEAHAGHAVNKSIAYSGFMGFMYLQLLDASFSLDGVIGAFAMSKDVVLIMIGLGIGAMFVRSLTVYLVKKGTLDEYVFLEHGAHYGIAALAVIMLISMVHEVPEVVTGLIGVTFIGLSLLSSVKYRRARRALTVRDV